MQRATAPAFAPTSHNNQYQHDGDELHSQCDITETKGDPPIEMEAREKIEMPDQGGLLESQLYQLRRRMGLPTRDDERANMASEALSATLNKLLDSDRLFLGQLDLMATNQTLSPPVNPLSTFIHLPKDMEQRRAILRSMQELKLRRGIDAATEWLHHLDHTAPFLDEKGFAIANGDFYYNRFQIDQFPNFHSARRLYNTFVQFLFNMEISITAGLGQFTLREDSDDSFDPTIWNHRFVTVTEDVGVPEEVNCVGFAQFYPHSPYTNSPMGIIVADTVNVDDLYPYVPEERTCKDIQSVHMVFETRKPGTNETVVVFKHCCFSVQLSPQFEVAPVVLAQLHRNLPNWPSYMIQFLRQYVAPNTIV